MIPEEIELDDESLPTKRQIRAVASDAPEANKSCLGFQEIVDIASLACELNSVTSDIGTWVPGGASGIERVTKPVERLDDPNEEVVVDTSDFTLQT